MTLAAHPQQDTRVAYVLGILPEEEKSRFEIHLVDCPHCRLEVEQERRVGKLIKAAVQQTPVLSGARQRALMPHPPLRRSVRPLALTWARPLAAVGLTVVLFIGLFGLTWSGSSTAVAATATVTQTATMQPINPLAPQPTTTPSPTPIAQLPVPQQAPSP